MVELLNAIKEYFEANPFRKALGICFVLMWLLFVIPAIYLGDPLILWFVSFVTLVVLIAVFGIASDNIETKKRR